MAASESESAAAELRLRGNHEFAQGQYDHAVALYTAALEACHHQSPNDNNNNNNKEERILNLCNRSACWAQQEEWDRSREDAQEAWNLSGHRSVKAAYRLAKTCYVGLQDSETAKTTLQAALRVLQERELTPIRPADLEQQQQQQQQQVKKRRPAVPDRRLKLEEDVNDDDHDEREPDKDDDAHETLPTMQQKEQERQRKNLQQHMPPPDIAQQRRSLQELLKQVLEAQQAQNSEDIHHNQPEVSIKYAQRPISIKEFTLQEELGHGNFSEIVKAQHKITGEQFALKRIAKKQAADLAKRQHPNVYNEIQMERRILLERLAEGHEHIIRMYHAFQDYNHLYYLMDWHTDRGDVWGHLRYKHLPGYGPAEIAPSENAVMMGCHRSTAKLWLYQLVDALEFMHARGVVHRDLKPENLLLDCRGNLIVIDFGTAKDLLQTDLNGPEFVGTPDFMSPEAVMGGGEENTASHNSSLTKPVAGITTATKEATTSADLWALGAVCFQLQTGHTPYWCPSPYLAFLKIKRALLTFNLRRSLGVVDDDCWDFIAGLMKGQAHERLGADVFTVQQNGKGRHMEQTRPDGYNVLRQHPYLLPIHEELQADNDNNNTAPRRWRRSKAVPIPTLSDLCLRAVAEMAYRDSLDVELCDRHPPGDGSRHDLLRLKWRERNAVLHCLDRRQLLKTDPRLYARFFADTVAARLDKVRPWTHSFVGLEQMNDEQGKPPKAQMHDPYAKPVEMDPIRIVNLTNPLLGATAHDQDEATRKQWIKLLKKCIASINRSRPKMVVVTAQTVVEPAVRKLLARISESIPVVLHDGSGSDYFTFWISGVQCLALSSNYSTSTDHFDNDEALHWLREQLEQVRMSKHPLYAFVNADPRALPQHVLKRLARGRTLLLCGLTTNNDSEPASSDGACTTTGWESKIAYKANELVHDDSNNKDDVISIRSTASDEEDDKDCHTMKVSATCVNGLRWITVEEEPDLWSTEFQAITDGTPAKQVLEGN